ncbi:acyl-coenzyme A thioesterase 11-like isoform X2 [Corticium candelabrum]|uniref:acyl-coenzyme A thioesterase 11-like isoform X2 n=1 Tax=Corticium candelabrum TaxID=121492 RepID=UPI002E261C4E|nr:acyl-coenzyme A thioesterase 11-like isoform X2 [Corticium candelabrum]
MVYKCTDIDTHRTAQFSGTSICTQGSSCIRHIFVFIHLVNNFFSSVRQASLHNICNIVQDLQRTVPESSRIGLSRDDVGRKVECRRTTVESLELVMPQHANHHGTAFGGQILEWMGNVAFIAASRVCQTVMTMPVALDRVIFRRPANVGDRLFLKACVNAIFHTTMEVGVRVEAQAVGGEARHISSAFTTFAVSSDTDSVIVLPQLETSNEIEKRRCSEAQARYFSRLSRKSLSDGEKSVLHWSETETLEMSLENMSRLASLMAVSEWQPINDDSEVKLHKYEQDENVAIKLQFEIDGSAKEVYTLVSDIKQRQHWDKLCRQSHILRRITDTDAIVQLIMDPMQLGHNAKEFVLLASHHFASCDNDYYALALTSIEYQLSYGYQASNCERAEVLSSGYVVRELPFEGPSEEGRAKCCVTYFHQLSATVLPYIGGDLVGLTAVLINTGRRLKSYITTKLISDHSEG